MAYSKNRITQLYTDEIPASVPQTSPHTPNTVKLKKVKIARPYKPPECSGEPWEQYEHITRLLDYEGTVYLAERKRDQKIVHMRLYPAREAQQTLNRHSAVQHQNIVAVQESFQAQENLYIVFEEMSVTLDQTIDLPGYRHIAQSANVMGQVRHICSLLC